MCRATAGQGIAERRYNSIHLTSGFMREFQTELVDAGGPPVIQVRACFLRLGTETRIAAAYVGHHRMRAACRVAQGHTVFFAGPAAVAIAGPGGEKAAENAVL